MTDVTAQAFREAAHKEAERAELSSRLGRQQLYFHESPINVIQRENAGLLLAAAEQREELDKGQQPCVWTEDMDGLWESICSNHGPFQFFDGGPIDNHVAFCPYCGHPITAVSYSETIEQQIATLTAERDEARQHCEDLKAAYIQGLTKPTRQQLQEFGARGDTKDDNT